MEIEVIPAILVKSRDELLSCIGSVRPHVKEMQIDVMDGLFVPNTTLGLEGLEDLPPARYEFHWMVEDPERWIRATPGDHMHLVHVETFSSIDAILSAVRAAGGRLGLAINPDTPIERIIGLAPQAVRLLVMTVRPGFSGQKYIKEMEPRIRKLRSLFPDKDIEVDGGINLDTIAGASAAGANILAAASAIFKSDDIGSAVSALSRRAKEASS